MRSLMILLMLIAPVQKGKNAAFTINLAGADGKNASLLPYSKKSAIALVFLLTDCPASQGYTLTLNQLQKEYSSKDIQLAGIFPGKYVSAGEMKAFCSEYKISFPVFRDPDMQLTKMLGASVAPEAFLLNGSGNIIYRGRIDDWFFAPGKKRTRITTHDLKDAIDAALQHRIVYISETKAIGCVL